MGLPTLMTYHEDKDNSKIAGGALWKFFTGLKREKWNNVIAHSMGNRVLRYVRKLAAEDSSWHTDALKEGTNAVLQAAPEDLKNNDNLFDNIFLVSADIPESVFDKPDAALVDDEEAEHALLPAACRPCHRGAHAAAAPTPQQATCTKRSTRVKGRWWGRLRGSQAAHAARFETGGSTTPPAACCSKRSAKK